MNKLEVSGKEYDSIDEDEDEVEEEDKEVIIVGYVAKGDVTIDDNKKEDDWDAVKELGSETINNYNYDYKNNYNYE